MLDAIVIGGGIVGASTAYHLVAAGARTLLLDRRDVGRATDAGAGILSPLVYSDAPHPWRKLGVEAFEYFEILQRQLREEDAGDTGYSRCSRLLVAISEEEIPLFERVREQVRARRRRGGESSGSDVHELSGSEARGLFPPLADVHGALRYEASARMDGRLFSRALLRAAEGRGLEIRQDGAQRLLLGDGAVRGVEAGGESIEARHVVIAGGAWSAAFGEQLDVSIPIEPQRGQILHLRLPLAETERWPIVSAFRDHYMVAWPDSRVVAGATRETGSGFAAGPTAGGVHETLAEALRVAPGLAPAEIVEIRVGLRPLCADGLPVLGPIPGVAGIHLATGHGASGLQAGPYTGKLVAEVITGDRPPADLSPFGVGRLLRRSS